MGYLTAAVLVNQNICQSITALKGRLTYPVVAVAFGALMVKVSISARLDSYPKILTE